MALTEPLYRKWAGHLCEIPLPTVLPYVDAHYEYLCTLRTTYIGDLGRCSGSLTNTLRNPLPWRKRIRPGRLMLESMARAQPRKAGVVEASFHRPIMDNNP